MGIFKPFAKTVHELEGPVWAIRMPNEVAQSSKQVASVERKRQYTNLLISG